MVEATFDLETKVAAVTYDPSKVSAEAVRKAIEDANLKLQAENAPRADIEGLLGTGPCEEG